MRAAALFGLALALSGAGCSCDDTTFNNGEARLAIDPPRIDLGRVFVGSSARGDFVLSAPGTLSVSFRAELQGDAAGWQVGPAAGSLSANGSVQGAAVFRPTEGGPATARAVFLGQGTTNASVSVELTAIGVEPPDCEDGNGCTVDRFDLGSGRCEHTFERLPCNDFNGCTAADTCVEGVCLGESFSCDDNDICTDDLCDPRSGCEHVLTRSCQDSNPCTFDRCDPTEGCVHDVLADGTPCDDFEQCTIGDICLMGECRGVNVPEGLVCDDGNPCSKNDQCLMGRCRDPSYVIPGIGGVKWAADVGPLAEGASENPIVDREGTVFAGVEGGYAAVDRCGDLLWVQDAIGSPRARASVSLPGVLSVAVGSSLVDLDTQSGAVIRRLDLASLLPLTSSTATASVQLLDLALRASGALVASLLREERQGELLLHEGVLAEIDRSHAVATLFRRTGTRYATRLAVDQDESVVAILREGPLDKSEGVERVVRYGIGGLPAGSWSSNEAPAWHTDLALGAGGEVYWSHGLDRISRQGAAETLLVAPELASLALTGAPVLRRDRVVLARVRSEPQPMSIAPAFVLSAVDTSSLTVAWEAALPADPRGMSPCVDELGNVFVATADGQVHGYTAEGLEIFHTPLPLAAESIRPLAPTIGGDAALILITDGRVIGIQVIAPLAASPWPRHRRDNLSTGHR